MNDERRSECLYSGIPNTEIRLVRCLTTVPDDKPEQGKANGNLEYSSITVNKYRFSEDERKVPLKLNVSLL